MTEKTIADIKREYSSKAVELQRRRYARLDELAALRTPTGDPYFLDRLNDAQKHQVLAEQKAELAEEDRRQLRQEFERAHGEYAAAAEERTAQLRERLFAVPGGESADLLARLATASEAELGSMLDIATEAGNRDLARAVFAASHQRGLGDLQHKYFAEVDPEAQGLYHEFNASPPPETLAKQKSDIDQMLPPASAETLAGTPPVYS